MDDDFDLQLSEEQMEALERNALEAWHEKRAAEQKEEITNRSSAAAPSGVIRMAASQEQQQQQLRGMCSGESHRLFDSCPPQLCHGSVWRSQSPEPEAATQGRRHLSQETSSLHSDEGADMAAGSSNLGKRKEREAGGFRIRIEQDVEGWISSESAFNKDLVAAFRLLPSRKWDAERRLWLFPLPSLPLLLSAVHSALPAAQVQLSPLLLNLLPTHRSSSSSRATTAAEGQLGWELPQKEPLVAAEVGGEDGRGNSGAQEAIRSIEAKVEYQMPQMPQMPQVPQMLHMAADAGKRERDGALEARENRGEARESRLVKLQATEDLRVAASFVPHNDLERSMKSMGGCTFDERRRAWMVPFSRLEEMSCTLQSMPSVQVTIANLPSLVQRAFSEAAAVQSEEDRFSRLPEEMRRQLMPFQEQGIRHALQRGGRVLLADEMGLGKTVQALGIAACFHEEWPVLVIAPSALRLHWAASAARWLHLEPRSITVLMPSSVSSNSSREGFQFVSSTKEGSVEMGGIFNIISYDLLARIKDSNFKVVIADESHYLKNFKAKRTLLCVPLLQKARRAILLSGTPALSRPIDLFKQLAALLPRVFNSMQEYGRRYCSGGRFGEFGGCSNVEELHSLLRSTLMIRRLKCNVLQQLPAKRRQQVMLMLPDVTMKPLKLLLEKLREIRRQLASDKEQGEQQLQQREKLEVAERSLISKLYSETGVAKIDAVTDYLSTLLESGTKLLIFAHHQAVLDGIHNFLQKQKVGLIRIDGSTPPPTRFQLVAKFQETSSVLVALLGIKAAGVGLSLTAASCVVFAEMTWNPSDLLQAEDRVHRIGQERSVNIVYLHAQDTADDLLWDVVQHKLDNLGQFVDGASTSMTAKTLKAAEKCQRTILETLQPR